MNPTRFPPVVTAQENGLLGIGGDLEIETLLDAYSHGVFPWPNSRYPEMLWFSPPERAILEFKDFRLSRRDAQALKKTAFTFTVGKDFESVIRGCADTPRAGQDGTWLTRPMIQAYTRLHKAGYAQSFEVWDERGRLVGGLYGVLIKRYFSAESMFRRASDASKFALAQAISHLKTRGLSWLDIQVMTPHMQRHGAHLVARAAFVAKLQQSLGRAMVG